MTRILFVACFVAMALVHAIVAFWTPVQGDAWLHWVWAGRHPGAGIGTWLAAHLTSADTFGYILARCHGIHVVVAPMLVIALVMGLFTVALRRTPRATGEDLLALALTSALIWIAQPHAGMTLFYTPSLAMHVAGAAAAVWLIAPLRCGWDVPRIGWPALVVAGYLAGTSTRAIALVTLVSVIVLVRHRPRERWMWVALGGLVVGVIVGFARPPYLEVGKVFRRGLDPNLFVLNLPIQAIGKVVALVAVFALVDLGRGVFGRSRVPVESRPEARESAWLLFAYLATSVWCLFGPKYFEATLLPATCLLVVAALPWLLWFATARGHRLVLVVFAVAVHAVAWSVALHDYRTIGAEGAERQRILEHTHAGGTAVVHPFHDILPTSFFFGEDLAQARMRQLVATEALGIRDIVIEPAFRRFEPNPGVVVSFEQEGATPQELQAARAPELWSTVPSVAREQFEQLVHRLQAGGAHVTARLVARLAVPGLGARPLLLAWADAKELVSPRVALSTLDEENQYTVKLYSDLKRFHEAWWLQGGVLVKTPYRNGSPRVRPTLPVLNGVIVCDDRQCLLADAFVPHF
jgi:hypothetical protein